MNNSSSKAPALEVKRVSKSFPGVQAVKDVDLKLQGQEFHAIIGENGAGKSTLMNCIIGLVRPDEGEIRIGGDTVHIASPMDAQKFGIGIVPQELNLVPMLSVTENILLGMHERRFKGLALDWKASRQKVVRIIQEMGEDIDPDAQVSELSSAQQQLVQIGRAMTFGARILIFDEPTASLTLQEADRLFLIIRRFLDSGGGVLYISHRLEEILSLADLITVMRDGEKAAELTPSETSMDEMVRHMVGRRVERVVRDDGSLRIKAEKRLEVTGLTRHGEFENISFSVHAGEILGMAGLVGAGRTELAKCLFGATHPHAGTVRVDGRPVVFRYPGDAVKNGVVYVPEERRALGIFPVLSVRENMTIAVLSQLRKRGRIDRDAQKRLAEEYVKMLNIKAGDIEQQIRNLSGGNQQKTILARWLIAGAKVLVLDEPTRGIDVKAKGEIHTLLRRLAQQGYAIVFISSELQEVIDIADQILILHEGKQKGVVSAEAATQEQLLTTALS